MRSSFSGRVLPPLLFLAQVVAACTVGAFGPTSNPGGRPILWKNRDVSNPEQEFRHYDSDRYRFVANAYAGDTLNVWAGINEAGFAIMNSNSYNIGGWAEDDGLVMRLALANCATVEEFAKLMDSLNEIGREVACNFGVFDSTGRTEFFEASNTWYKRFPTADDSFDLLLRANYSMSGDSNRMTGKERWIRATRLVHEARAENRIDVPFLVRELSRDIALPDLDPYPLPFEGISGGLPYGWLPLANTINRRSTKSVEILVGRRPGEPVNTGMMWALCGGPEVSLPVPIWVSGGPTSRLLDGDPTAELCDSAISLRGYTFPDPDRPDAINTYAVVKVLETFSTTESTLFALTAAKEEEWAGRGPTSEEASAFTDSMCRLALNAYGLLRRQGSNPQPDSGDRLRPTLTEDRLLIRLPEGANHCRIYDGMGRLVATIFSRKGALIRWDAAGLAGGSYFVLFPQEPDIEPARFVRIR